MDDSKRKDLSRSRVSWMRSRSRFSSTSAQISSSERCDCLPRRRVKLSWLTTNPMHRKVIRQFWDKPWRSWRSFRFLDKVAPRYSVLIDSLLTLSTKPCGVMTRRSLSGRGEAMSIVASFHSAFAASALHCLPTSRIDLSEDTGSCDCVSD
jgi:hypothetical protein